jgi:hypothetical protein
MPTLRLLATSLVTLVAIAVPAIAQDVDAAARQQEAAFQASAPWQDFLADAGGEWRVEWCAATGTPRAIWGSGMPLADWRENSLEEARRHANQLLRERSELLGLGDSEFREVIGARMHRVWSFTFDQFHRGLPVLGGRADVRVHMVGRVSMFGAKAVKIPADFDLLPAFDADTALAIAWQQVGAPTGAPQPGAVKPPRLVIWSDVEAKTLQTPRLQWEVAINNVDAAGNGPIGRYYVDARTGAFARFETDKHECGFDGCTIGKPAHAAPAAATPPAAPALAPINTTVTVMGWTRAGLDGFSPLVNVPLPGLVLNVGTVGAVTTDSNGQFTVNIALPAAVNVSQLDGRHHQPIAGASAPSGSFTIQPGVATTIQLLTSTATAAAAAHTTVTYWVDKVNQWARGILGSSLQLALASNVLPTVNIGLSCNAYYTGNTINFYAVGGGCVNSAFSTVIAHEWGHGLDDRFGGISQTDGLSEGWADIVALYLCDTPNLASGLQTAGEPLRSGDNAALYPCTACGVHTAGQTWMGFAWKLRNRLATTLNSRPFAIAVTNNIVVSTIVADATDQAGAVLEVYLADDDDGNLVNGTPNKADLDWACNQHLLPIPLVTVGVPANNECVSAITVVDGVNGPYTTINATTSAPAWSCGSADRDVWFRYVATQAGTLTVSTCDLASWDTVIEVRGALCTSGVALGCNDDACGPDSSVTVQVGVGSYLIRVGGHLGSTGPFRLYVEGPTAATAASYGAGCYVQSRSFYEYFAPGSFDLASRRMRLSYDPAGFYVASAAGAYVTPSSGAQTLALTDDGVATVALASPLNYPGGTTSSLDVCANGFVSAGVGNGSSATPSVAAWLASFQARWGSWHDFNPAAPGSGQVRFEQIGAMSYVTWQGVYTYGTSSPATFQLQFDRATGNVTYVWNVVALAPGGWLVGFAAAQPNNDPGNRDISTSLNGSGTFVTSPINLAPLALAATPPVLGSTMTLTTTNFTAAAPVGVQILSTTRVDPGFELTPLGMPGCFQHVAPTALYTIAVSGGTATFALPIPNNSALIGFQMFAQSLGFAVGVNAADLITSNGMALRVGL